MNSKFEKVPLWRDSSPTRASLTYHQKVSRIAVVAVLAGIVAIHFMTSQWSFTMVGLITSKDDQVLKLDPRDPESFEEKYPLREPSYWKYNISESHTRKLRFTTDEGTWLNLDISTDGSQLLFDLLGDIYTLPVEGGDATLLRGGVSFDTQPRYSPDGEKVLFRSDASGCDNLWVMENRAGGKAWPLTNESYRFSSDAQWHPNATEVVAVKWFTQDRSIPAGEIWTYSIDSESTKSVAGERFIARTTSNPLTPYESIQIGPEEPVYYPLDPEIIFYSQNVADDNEFNYNKDIHKGIYVIRKYNRHTNATTTVVSGPGGASRPVLSKNGRFLAFVKTVEFKTALMLKELESGDEVILWDGLDNHQQASSAPTGTYPSFVFVDSDTAIIIWAKGKIWRVPLSAAEKIKEIPFKVNVELDMAPTVRSKDLDIRRLQAEIVFRAKGLRGLRVWKKWALFSAIGETYVMNLKEPSKLIQLPTLHHRSQTQYSPNFYPPNPQIFVQATWSNKDFSSLELIDIVEGTATIIKGLPHGRWVSPTVSFCGRKLAVIRLSGDNLSGYIRATAEAGLWVFDLSPHHSGTWYLSNGKLISPDFASSTLHLQFPNLTSIIVSGTGNTITKIDFDKESSKTETLFTAKENSEIVHSLDGRYIAWIDYEQVYVAPTDSITNDTQIWSKPGYEPKGTLRVSVDGGHDLTWDNGLLYYLLGNRIFLVEVEELYKAWSTCGNANAALTQCKEKYIKEIEVKIDRPVSEIPSNTMLVLDHVTIVTMEHGVKEKDILKDSRVVIYDGRILAIGSIESLTVPADAEILDFRGRTIIPAFIDVHAHWNGGHPGLPVTSQYEFLLNSAYGVLTLHNPSYDTLMAQEEKELVLSGKMVGPRIFSTGIPIYGAGSSYKCEINTLEDARQYLSYLKAHGHWSVKSYQQPCRQARLFLLKAAKELNMDVVTEGGMNYWWDITYALDGHSSLEHAIPIEKLYKDAQTVLAKTGSGYTPTLIVSYGNIMGEGYWYQHTKVWENKKLRQFHPLRDLEAASFRGTFADKRDYSHFETSRSVKELSDLGGTINVGAHGQRQGLGYHWELWMLSQGNMTNYDILKAATFNGAKSLGLIGVGSIRPGYLADILIYDDNSSPLEDIRKSTDIKFIIKGGRVWRADDMTEIWPKKRDSDLPPLNVPYIHRDNH